jgi:diaminopimelate decarboxylase
MPEPRAGDLLVVRSAGAYGFSMSSNYNARPRAAELLVDGDRVHVARRRETWTDLVRGEAPLPDADRTAPPGRAARARGRRPEGGRATRLPGPARIG